MKNSNTIELESKVIQQYVIKSKRSRFLAFIQTEKNRKKFIQEFSHMNFLDFDRFERVLMDEQEVIFQRLKHFPTFKDCYVLSEIQQLDKRRIDIETALVEIIGSDAGSIVVFGEGELVYIEAEGLNNRWISKL